ASRGRLPEATSGRAEVVKGAACRRVYGLDSRLVTSAGASVRDSSRVAADSWVSTVADFARDLRAPSSGKSIPVATRAPSTVVILAVNWQGSLAKGPVASQ